MEQLCPYCGNELGEEEQCGTCLRQVAWVKKCYLKSRQYYVKAYEAAKHRKLTTAGRLLKKAIYFSKYNIQARNLLGLIYYEMGEFALALKQWQMSQALKKEDNIAAEYIEKLQSHFKTLEAYREAGKLYNKALECLKRGNEDVAVINLRKAVSVNEKFIEAKALLALCYMKSKQLRRAHEQLEEILRIDQAHSKANEYLNNIRDYQLEDIQHYERERVRQGQAGSEKKVTVSDKSSLLLRYTLYFLMGVLCTWIAESNLVTPSKVKDYKAQIVSLNNEKEALDTAMDTLKLEHEEDTSRLQTENEQLKADKAAYEEEMGRKTQQEKMVESEKLMNQGDYEGAAQILYNIAPKYLSQEENADYEELKERAYSAAGSSLCSKGYEFLRRENFSEAKSNLESALLYAVEDENKKRILYYLGRAERGLGNDEKAISYYNEVICDYPDTTEAIWAQSRLDEIKKEG